MNEQSKLHPSGLTWERWNFPFKNKEERLMIEKYYKSPPTLYDLEQRKAGFDTTIPF